MTATTRITIDPAKMTGMLNLFLLLDSCECCGDDIDLHDWIDLNADGVITNCDRA